MKTKSLNMLPKTADEISTGGLYFQAVRCGKKGCRCASGALHQGYCYFIRRIDGRLRKTYVPKNQTERMISIVRGARQNRKIERADLRSSLKLLSELRATLRENESAISISTEAHK